MAASQLKKIFPVKPLRSSTGFTLIEIMMVLFFAGILMVVIFNLYDWYNKLYNYQQGLVRVTTGSRTAVQTLQSYVSQSKAVLASASVNGTTYSSSTTTLVTQLPSIDSSNNLVAGKWDKAVFYASGPNFYLQVEPDPASSRLKLYKLLSDSLQSLSFGYNNADFSQVSKVTVNFQAALQVRDQKVISNLQQDMYLLNF